jgi:serine/threonine protein kinase
MERVLKTAIYGHIASGYELELVDTAENKPTYRRTDRMVAIKVMRKSKIRQMAGSAENPFNEIAVMQLFKNCKVSSEDPAVITCDGPYRYDNLIYLIEACQDAESYYAVMEYIDGMDLMDYLKTLQEEGERLDESKARLYFSQIVQGLTILHSLGVCHRDISLENIMVTKDLTRCVIIDFGMAIKCDRDESCGSFVQIAPTGHVGKTTYMAPEVYAGTTNFSAGRADWWSVGIVLFMMLTNVPPFQKPSRDNKAFLCLANGKIPQMLKVWGIQVKPAAINLLLCVLQEKPEHRISLSDMLRHEWCLTVD